MFHYLFIILLSVIFAYIIQERSTGYSSVRLGIKLDLVNRLIYIAIIVMLVMFSGLRSSYNDTQTYKDGFYLLNVNKVHFSTIFQSYGGFDFFQMLIKKYITTNSQMLIFLSSILTNILYIPFLVRHTERFPESIFLYLIGLYSFSMGGVKQAIAMAIGCYALDAFIKKRYIRSILFLLIAMSFHPYIICLVCVVFLGKHVWKWNILLIVIAIVFFTLNLETVFSFFGAIGKDYSSENLAGTINPFRLVIEGIPILISFLCRDKINSTKDKFFIIGINLQTVAFFVLCMGLFINPMYVGRVALYFSLVSCMVIPKLLSLFFEDSKSRLALTITYYLVFFVYFLLDLTKMGTFSIFYDQLNHVSLSQIY